MIAIALALSSGTACGGATSSGATRDELVRVHERAPDFEGPDQDGRARSLRDYRGKIVVLYFYPRDGTPGCTHEACAFRDAWDRLESAGAVVVGVSRDSVASHAAFAREHSLQFPLIADTDGHILAAYGVSTTFGIADRVTFVLDPSGVVVRVFPDVDPAVHVEEVLHVIDSLRAVERRPITGEGNEIPSDTSSRTSS